MFWKRTTIIGESFKCKWEADPHWLNEYECSLLGDLEEDLRNLADFQKLKFLKHSLLDSICITECLMHDIKNITKNYNEMNCEELAKTIDHIISRVNQYSFSHIHKEDDE